MSIAAATDHDRTVAVGDRLTRAAPVFLVLVAIFPFLPNTRGLLGSAAQAAVFTLVAASLVLLTGWVGQISLAHGAFVGIGAYATGWAVNLLGIGFPLTLPIAVLVAGGVAALLGLVALRVRGLYLAVATLIFSWAASEFLFRQDWLLAYGSVPLQTIGEPGMVFHVDFTSRMTFYYVAWGVTIGVLAALVSLRESRTGRAFFAIRGSEMAAASLGMDVLRYKALAFALSGGLAGIAGNLTMSHALVVSPDAFDFNASLFFLAIAVVGGLTSLPGAVAAGVLFAAMNELFFQIAFLNEYLQLVSTGLLAVVFLLYPGGLASLGVAAIERLRRLREFVTQLPAQVEVAVAGAAVRVDLSSSVEHDEETEPDHEEDDRPLLSTASDALLARLHRRLRLRRPAQANGSGVLSLELPSPEPEPTEVAEPVVEDASTNGDLPASFRDLAAATVDYDPSSRDERPALVEAEGVIVRFGGLTAVDDASLKIPQGEITGLIGPNGAGKTTLFNAIAGFNEPTEGTIRIHGNDATHLPVHRRAALGVGRTFQLIQLFPQLTVFDNLLAATHLQNPTGFVQHLAVTPAAIDAELSARARVRRVVELLELGEFAHRPVAGLPFGILRMVEVARALAGGSPVIMLDEPASGLDERETDRLVEVLRFVRGLGASLLLIEHDIRMVTAVTDFIYVLERGRIIATGTPAEIQNDPAVVAAYLGQPKTEEAVVG